MQFPSQRYDGLTAVRNRCPGSASQADPRRLGAAVGARLQHERRAPRTVRRIAFIALGLVVVAIAVALLEPTHPSGSASGSGTYLVRAIFDDASFAAQGEDVRIAGANVGSIQSLGVTSGKRAAVTIAITDHRFAPFHTRRHLRDPAAVAHRRGVRRLHARHRGRARAAAHPLGSGRRQLLPAGHPHELADRLRHRPGHLHRAGAPVAGAHHQRVRDRPGRARLGSQRGHPPRQPGPGQHRQGAQDPRPAEPHPGPAGHRLRHGAGTAGARAQPDLGLHHPGQHHRGGQRRPRPGDLRDLPEVPHLPGAAAPADGRPGHAGRPGHPADDQPGPERGRAGPAVRQPHPVRRPGADGAHQPRRRRPAVAALAAGHPAAGQTACCRWATPASPPPRTCRSSPRAWTAPAASSSS